MDYVNYVLYLIKFKKLNKPKIIKKLLSQSSLKIKKNGSIFLNKIDENQS
jgi:hypothetical protein